MINELKQSLGKFKSNLDCKIVQHFDNKIKTQKKPELQEVWANLRDYVLQGGKRLRPYLLHQVNEEFKQVEGIDDVLLAFELLHNSTLIDDDIIDEHDTRRDKPTLPTIYSCSIR